MPKALVEPSGRIAQISAEEFAAAPSLRWIDCGDDITTAHRYIDGEFVAPPEPESTPPAPLPRLTVADRLTDDEVATVAALQSGSPEQQRWWLRWVSAITVDPSNPETVAGFKAVFGDERAAELLAPEA